MGDRRQHRQHQRGFDDGWRSTVATGVSLLVPVTAGVAAIGTPGLRETLVTSAALLSLMCGLWVVFALVYLVWTHLQFSRVDRDELRRIADIQHHRRPSPVTVMLGFSSSGTGTVSAATFALFAAVGTALVGVDALQPWRLVLVLLTVAASWATMVYAFALRYLRLDAAGETIAFEIADAPGFADFVSMSVLISSVGALSAGTPRTSAALAAVRTHTLFAFVFNAFIVALTVSLVVGLITS